VRVDLDYTMLHVALVLSQRSTCVKLRVGAVLTNEKGIILGTGYNGVPRSMKHCIDAPCSGASAPKGADLCEAVHAEQNALLQCKDTEAIVNIYVTHAPCMRCTKLLLNTRCAYVYFLDGSNQEASARDLWLRAGRYWLQYLDGPQVSPRTESPDDQSCTTPIAGAE